MCSDRVVPVLDSAGPKVCSPGDVLMFGTSEWAGGGRAPSDGADLSGVC